VHLAKETEREGRKKWCLAHLRLEKAATGEKKGEEKGEGARGELKNRGTIVVDGQKEFPNRS